MGEEIKRKRQLRKKKIETRSEDFNQPDAEQNESFQPIDETEEVKEEIKDHPKIVKPELGIKPKVDSQFDNHRDRTFLVRIKGVERYVTEAVIQAASKDKTMRLEIPKESKYNKPEFSKCKDC